MSATTPRVAKGATIDDRRILIALLMLTASVALLVAVIVGQQALKSPAAPLVSQARELIISNPDGGSLRYTGIPYPPRVQGLQYTGIPYVPTKSADEAPYVPSIITGDGPSSVMSPDVQQLIVSGAAKFFYTGIPYVPSQVTSGGDATSLYPPAKSHVLVDHPYHGIPYQASGHRADLTIGAPNSRRLAQ
jgi:hypothetical protein